MAGLRGGTDRLRKFIVFVFVVVARKRFDTDGPVVVTEDLVQRRAAVLGPVTCPVYCRALRFFASSDPAGAPATARCRCAAATGPRRR